MKPSQARAEYAWSSPAATGHVRSTRAGGRAVSATGRLAVWKVIGVDEVLPFPTDLHMGHDFTRPDDDFDPGRDEEDDMTTTRRGKGIPARIEDITFPYAVYVVVVEDSEEADLALMSSVASGERIGGGMTQENAEGVMERIAVQEMER